MLTGHTGFVGSTVRKVAQRGSRYGSWRIVTLPDAVDLRAPDLASRIADIGPDAVLHLAARTSVADSFQDPDGFFDVNFHGTWNLLRALHAADCRGRMLFVSSGDCYGTVSERSLPIIEAQPLRPRNPYAVSKAAAEALCYQWSQTEPLEVIIARPFNHIGPSQDARFATASFARQVARIRAGVQAPRIVTGDLDVTRDMTDVRDVAEAYFALLEGGRCGEVYNVGTGRETRLRDVLSQLLTIAEVEAEVVIDAARLRSAEQRRAAADVHKIEHDTGWRSVIPLSTTLRDMLDDWTERIKRE